MHFLEAGFDDGDRTGNNLSRLHGPLHRAGDKLVISNLRRKTPRGDGLSAGIAQGNVGMTLKALVLGPFGRTMAKERQGNFSLSLSGHGAFSSAFAQVFGVLETEFPSQPIDTVLVGVLIADAREARRSETVA